MLIWLGLVLAIVVYGINMFGDAVRDILNPRLKGGIGRYGVRAKKGARREMGVKEIFCSCISGNARREKRRYRPWKAK